MRRQSLIDPKKHSPMPSSFLTSNVRIWSSDISIPRKPARLGCGASLVQTSVYKKTNGRHEASITGKRHRSNYLPGINAELESESASHTPHPTPPPPNHLDNCPTQLDKACSKAECIDQ